MLVENNPDFKTIWQLAHNWASEETDKTDPNAISPELTLAIDRLMRVYVVKTNWTAGCLNQEML